MDINIEIRKKQLDNLEQLISSSRQRIHSVLNYLGWSAENVSKDDLSVQCPINLNHKINPQSWNNHVETCLIKAEGYDLKEPFLSESLNDPAQSIYLDRHKKIEIVTKELTERGTLRIAWNGLDPDPRTSDRLTSTYSSDERLVFYNYCIQNTVGPPPPPEFTTIGYNNQNGGQKELSYEELLTLERDSKRRRAKYRPVHINRKNHTEVMREVINGQMEEFKEWLLTKNKRKEVLDFNKDDRKEDVDRPSSAISKTSNHSSSSRTTNRREKRDHSSSRLNYRNGYGKSPTPKEQRSRENGRHNSRERKYSRERHRSRNSSRDRDRRYSSRDRRHSSRDRHSRDRRRR